MSTECCPYCADPDKYDVLPAESVEHPEFKSFEETDPITRVSVYRTRKVMVTSLLHPDKHPCGGHIGVQCANQEEVTV